MKYKKEDIIDAVVKMRIEKGASSKTIIQEFLMEQLGYKISYSYVIYQEARQKIVELYSVHNTELANEALGQLESMLEDALKQKNMKLALEIRKEMSKLTGLYSPEKIDVSITEYKAKFPGVNKK
jgi:hypothetical protein